MPQTEESLLARRPFLLTLVSLVLSITATELFFTYSEEVGAMRWLLVLMAGGGILLVGLGLPLKMRYHLGYWLRSGFILCLAVYLMGSAFLRYPGLAKGNPATFFYGFSYLVRVVFFISIAVFLASLPRLFFSRYREDL